MTHDLAIVGGGMVGASLAVALAPLGLTIALIEAVPVESEAQPSFDERTTALSNGSRRVLETLGVFGELAGEAGVIRKIHVSEQGRFGFARIDAREQGMDALGYVVPNRALGRGLWAALRRQPGLDLHVPATVTAVVPGPASVRLDLLSGGVASSLEARLVVAADGAQSAVRAAFGIAAEQRDYAQTAIISTVLPQRFHEQVAYERFTPTGPLALLPLNDGRCTLVLTLAPEAAAAMARASDAEFLAELQRRFGFRLGRFLKVGRRSTYPLALTESSQTSAPRLAVIGNAAQGLHPVAGMGFNLGLRDAASLAELLAERAAQPGFDAGGAALLAAYDAWRRSDRRGVIGFTDGLIRTFASPLQAVGVLRNLALLTFDLLPPAKAALSRLSTGGGGRIPRLARGLALRD